MMDYPLGEDPPQPSPPPWSPPLGEKERKERGEKKKCLFLKQGGAFKVPLIKGDLGG